MLSYALAIIVAISSLVLFSTAFLMSKIHRRDDFLWSTVGLFYALVLWYCARNITGAVLLGQAAATILLVSYSWQTIKLRRMIAEPEKAAATENFSVLRKVNGLFKRQKPQVSVPPAPVAKPPMPTVTEDIAIPETPVATPRQTPKPNPTASEQATPATDAVPSPANLTPDTSEVAAPTAKTLEKTPEVEPTKPTKATTAVPPVSEPAKIAKPLVDIEIIDKATDDASDLLTPELTTPAQPLPSKLPEATNPETKPTPPSPSQTTTQPELSDTTQNEPTATLPIKEVEPPAEVNPAPPSDIDTLETVEVAEVLEAQSDRQANNRRSDRSDEIEVTATDVNIIAENDKIDRNQQGESDLNDV